MIRSLVPSVALIAVAAVAHGADSDWLKPEFRFGGFVDASADLGDDRATDNVNDSIQRNRWYADFHALAAAHVDVRFSDQVGGRVDLWLIPDTGNFTDTEIRDGYVVLRTGDWTAKAGKMIRPFGWESPQPDQWYRVTDSTIGYTGNTLENFDSGVFGQDVIGASLTWSRNDSPIRATGMLTNGFFSSNDTSTRQQNRSPNNDRQRNALGYGADVAFIPSDKATVDFQVGYDPRSDFEDYTFGMHDGIGVAGSSRGTFSRVFGANADSTGDVLLLDANTTLKPVRALTIGAEIARFHVGDSTNNNVRIHGTTYTRWQGLLMANWAFEQARFPISVTGEIQHILARQDQFEANNLNGEAWEYTAALLTQPFPRIPLHLDAELSYADVHSDEANGGSNGWQLSGRALLDF